MLTMAKPSAFMRQMAAQTRQLCDLQRRFTIQQMKDMAAIAFGETWSANHDDEDPPPELVFEFLRDLDVTLIEYAETAIDDDAKTGNNDPMLNYTKGKIDAALQRLLGDAFVPWEERYTF